MDITSYALVTFLVVGMVELIKAVFDRQYRTAVIILGAALVGGVCGYFGVQGLPDLATGIAVGLAGSGVVTAVSKASTVVGQ